MLSRSRDIFKQFKQTFGQIRKLSVPLPSPLPNTVPNPIANTVMNTVANTVSSPGSNPVASNISRPPLVKHRSLLVTDVLTNENSGGVLQVIWEDGATSTFSAILLRDSCRCSLCYDKHAQQRMLDTVKLVPLDITPRNVRICNQYVNVTWPDGHQSSYSHEYFSPDSREKADDIATIKPLLWEKKDVVNDIPIFNLESVLENDSVMFDWFNDLCTLGFTILKGAGTELNGLDRLKKIFGGYFRTTQYGDTFDIIVKDGANNLAFKPDAILPHMDLPHFEYFPGILALHCVKQCSGTGGASTLIDGFKVAQQLRELDRESYELLANHRVAFRDAGTDIYGDYDTRYERTIISEKDGEIYNLGYSNWLRDYHMKGSAEEIQKFFESYYKFTWLLTDPRYELNFKLNQGEMLVFDNRRMLHGRTAFIEGERTERHLHGCFFDWDSLLGYMRPVKKRLEDSYS